MPPPRLILDAGHRGMPARSAREAFANEIQQFRDRVAVQALVLLPVTRRVTAHCAGRGVLILVGACHALPLAVLMVRLCFTCLRYHPTPAAPAKSTSADRGLSNLLSGVWKFC